MSAVTRAALLVLCLSLSAGAQTRSLALYAGNAGGADAYSVRTAQQELQRLLAPIGVNLVWKNLQQRVAGENYDVVAVSSFDGSCSGVELPPAGLNLPETSVSLADASVSNGRVLPFFRIDCKYLLRMLAPSIRSLNPSQRSVIVGRALARLMAHELYHILAQTTAHQDRGIAKSAFSVHDLTSDQFGFDVWSLAQMTPAAFPAARDTEDPSKAQSRWQGSSSILQTR